MQLLRMLHQVGCLPESLILKQICVVLVIFNSVKEMSSATFERRKTLPDACPDVHLPPNAHRNTFLELQVMKGKNSIGEPVERMCCVCNPGFYLYQICLPDNRTSTICLPCPSGTYITDYAHMRRECTKEVPSCPHGKVWIPSQPHKAPRCDCQKDHHLSDDNETCEPHTLCGPGYGVKINPSHVRDTECEKCAHGYDSQSESYEDKCELIERSTQPQTTSIARSTFIAKIKNISSYNDSTLPPNTTAAETLTSSTVFNEQPEANLPLLIGVPLTIVGIIALIVIIAFIVRWNRSGHPTKREPNIGNVEEEQYLTSSSGELCGNHNVGAQNLANATPVQPSRRDEINTDEPTASWHVIEAAITGNPNPQLMSVNNNGAETSTSSNGINNNAREKLKMLWNEMKVNILLEDLHRFYRHFGEHHPNNVDQLLEDLRNTDVSIEEKASIAFSKLSQLSEENFNTRLIFEYFHNLGLRSYSQIAEKYL